jgi:hypothetical protein
MHLLSHHKDLEYRQQFVKIKGCYCVNILTAQSDNLNNEMNNGVRSHPDMQ